jgi:hypothetical protein
VPGEGIKHKHERKAPGEEWNLLVNRAYPIFIGHFHFQNDVEVAAHVRVFIRRHALVSQNDRHPRVNDLALGARYSHSSAVEVIDQYAVKAEKSLGKGDGNGSEKVTPGTFERFVSLSF